MTTTLTPPPVPPGAAADPGAPGQAPTPGAARVISILAIVFGALVILGAIGSAVVGTIVSAAVHTGTRTAAVAGVSGIDVDAAAGSLRIEFADVREAELEVTGPSGADRWTLDRDGDSLVVATPRMFGGWFFGGWFGGPGDAVLRLPQSLEGSDADIDFSAGDLNIDGAFGELDLQMNAGRAEVSGSATALSAEMNAGAATLDLADVRRADLSVSAGALTVRLSGEQPDAIEAGVSAGGLQLTVPGGEYDVTSDVSAGDFRNRIGSTPGASSTIHVEVSAGNVVLRDR